MGYLHLSKIWRFIGVSCGICFAQACSSPGNEAFWLFRGGWTPERQLNLFCDHWTAKVTKTMSLRKTCEMHSNAFILPWTTWTWCFCWGHFELWLTSQNQIHLIQKPNRVFELMFEAVIGWLAGILTKQSFLPHTSIYTVYPVWLLDGGYTLTLAQVHRLWLLRGVGCFRAEKFEESLEPTRGFHSFAGFRGCWLPGYAWVQAQVETWEFHCRNVRACETKQSSFGASNPYMFKSCLQKCYRYMASFLSLWGIRLHLWKLLKLCIHCLVQLSTPDLQGSCQVTLPAAGRCQQILLRESITSLPLMISVE